MISDLKHLSNRKERMPWSSFVAFLVIGVVLVVMGERDRAHMKDNQALAETVYAQAQFIETMQCGSGFEMGMPIEAGS
jgi:hypothetical protein